MVMIVYYLWLKLKLVLSPHHNLWGFIGLLLFIPLAILYGKGTAILIDGGFFELTQTLKHTFEIGLLGFVAVITFLRGFFPSYKPIHSHFKSFHPISSGRRFTLNVLDDFVSGYFITMGFFAGAFFFFSTTVGIDYLVYLVFALIGAHIVRRFVQVSFENRIKFNRQSSLLLFTCMVLLLLSAGLLLFFKRFAFWIITGSFCNLLIMDLILEEICPKEIVCGNSTGQTIRHYTIDLWLQNNIARTTLIV